MPTVQVLRAGGIAWKTGSDNVYGIAQLNYANGNYFLPTVLGIDSKPSDLKACILSCEGETCKETACSTNLAERFETTILMPANNLAGTNHHSITITDGVNQFQVTKTFIIDTTAPRIVRAEFAGKELAHTELSRIEQEALQITTVSGFFPRFSSLAAFRSIKLGLQIQGFTEDSIQVCLRSERLGEPTCLQYSRDSLGIWLPLMDGLQEVELSVDDGRGNASKRSYWLFVPRAAGEMPESGASPLPSCGADLSDRLFPSQYQGLWIPSGMTRRLIKPTRFFLCVRVPKSKAYSSPDSQAHGALLLEPARRSA